MIAVFDLDGTLIDSMPSFSAVMKSIPTEAGFPADDKLVNTVTPLGYQKTAEYYVAMGVPGTAESIVRTIEQRLYREYSETISLKPGVAAYLNQLKEHGARLFVLTASPHMMTDTCLKRNGVFALFEQVWSVDDYGITKTEVALFNALAERIGCRPEEIHYFDDNLTAIRTANQAGLITYGVFDRHPEVLRKELQEISQHFVATFEELIV